MLCVLLLTLSVLASSAAQAQTETTVRLMRDMLASDVVNRAPAPAPSPIPAGIGRLCYFTEVSAPAPATIHHVWIWRDREMATVALQVSGPRFRTWSCKNILPTWTGSWRVEARSADGVVLSSKMFTVGE